MYTDQQFLDALANVQEGDEKPYDGPFWTGSVDEPPKNPPPQDWAHRAARGVMACLNREESIYAATGPLSEEHRQVLVQEVSMVIRTALDLELSGGDPNTDWCLHRQQIDKVLNEASQRIGRRGGVLHMVALDANDGAGWKEYYANIDALCLSPTSKEAST